MMLAPKGERLHIGLFGRRNAGKSSLLNAITQQRAAIVAEHPGTTTDPVEKRMEMLPLGPVLLIDTAGLDDVGALGDLRVSMSRAAIARCDIAVLVLAGSVWDSFEEALLAELLTAGCSVVIAANQCDRAEPAAAALAAAERAKLSVVRCAAIAGQGVAELREALIRATPDAWLDRASILADLVPPGNGAVMVVPIDMEAPRGRLILPQVQSIRDLLDGDAWSLVVKEREFAGVLANLKKPPALVVCDSQVFLKVAADTPEHIPMTSFSVLFARYKGDLATFAAGASAIDTLRSGSRLLIAESCSHHPIGDDIGRVKIPRWLTQYVGGALDVHHYQGHDFPDPSGYDLVIHCGACVTNRREVLSRILRCREAGVPITNYGMAIAYSLGIFVRALAPFPEALAAIPEPG